MSVSSCKVAASIFVEGAEQTNQIAGVYVQNVNISRAFTEVAIPFSKEASKVNGKLAPLHIIGLIRAPADLVLIGRDIIDAVKAPSYLKLLPLLQIAERVGNILDYFNTSIWIAEQMGAVGIESLSAASLPIGGVAIGLQAIGIGIISWKMYENQAAWNKVQSAINSSDTEKAIKLLTQKPTSKLKKYKKKFFGIFTADHQDKIQAIYEKSKLDSHPSIRLNAMFKELKDYHFHKQLQAGISIALMIIGVIGVILVSFVATPVAPVAWGVLGVLGIVSLALVIGSVYKDRSFNQSLLNCLN